MSDFDRNAAARWGTGVAQAGTRTDIDQGLRSYMLGIYNHMTVALAISALVATGIVMMGRSSALAQLLYTSPLRYVIMLAPLGFVLMLSWRFEKMSYTSLLVTFWA